MYASAATAAGGKAAKYAGKTVGAWFVAKLLDEVLGPFLEPFWEWLVYRISRIISRIRVFFGYEEYVFEEEAEETEDVEVLVTSIR